MGEYLRFTGTFFCHQFFCQSAFVAVMLVGPDTVCLGANSTAAERSDSPVTKQPKRMDVTSVVPERGDENPAGMKRITYRSKNTVVYLPGSSSSAD